MSAHKPAVLILVDGLRPEAMLEAPAPTMLRLLAGGAGTLRARTVMPSVTLPCHTSLFYGVAPERHGITTNRWQPLARPLPSLFDVVHAAGPKTLAYYNWEELRDLGAPGALDEAHFIRYLSERGDESDQLLFDMATQRLARHDFGLAFLYYGSVDCTGHEHGWMSQLYLRRVADADRAIARVLPVLPPDCLVVLMADHGGHAKTHGSEHDQDMLIPVILNGPGIGAGLALPEPVNITDVAPTILHWMGIAAPREWTGRPLV